MLKKLTRKELAERAASRFAYMHSEACTSSYIFRGQQFDLRQIYDQLIQLDDPTPELVNEIIGNESFTRLECESCGKKVEYVIQFPLYFNGDRTVFNVCSTCISGAYELCKDSK